MLAPFSTSRRKCPSGAGPSRCNPSTRRWRRSRWRAEDCACAAAEFMGFSELSILLRNDDTPSPVLPPAARVPCVCGMGHAAPVALGGSEAVSPGAGRRRDSNHFSRSTSKIARRLLPSTTTAGPVPCAKCRSMLRRVRLARRAASSKVRAIILRSLVGLESDA
jgi:hypothetical protein